MYILTNFIQVCARLLGEEGLWDRYKRVFSAFFFRFNELFGQRFCRELLMCTSVRALVLYIRAIYFMEHKQMLRTFSLETGEIAPGTIKHNLRGLEALSRLELLSRVLKLVRPLSVLDCIDRSAKVLVIGPRTEDDLLTLVGHGFQPDNIRGLDIISYSPWVDLGDMHAMTYSDNSWDVILAGWVMPYSKDPAKLIAEIVRVAKPGAVVAVGFEYQPIEERLESVKTTGWQGSQMNSIEELHACFGQYRGDVIFTHDTSRIKPQETNNLVSIFRIAK